MFYLKVNESLIEISSKRNTPTIIVSKNPQFPNAINIYIQVDSYIIRCKNEVDAVGKLLKAFYVFNISYDPNLRHVFNYLAQYLFEINTKCTTAQMKILNTYIKST